MEQLLIQSIQFPHQVQLDQPNIVTVIGYMNQCMSMPIGEGPMEFPIMGWHKWVGNPIIDLNFNTGKVIAPKTDPSAKTAICKKKTSFYKL